MSGDFGVKTHPVSKLDRQCTHCLTTIKAGERHVNYAGKWMGDFQNWRVHEDCDKVIPICQEDDGMLCGNKHKRGKPCDNNAGVEDYPKNEGGMGAIL